MADLPILIAGGGVGGFAAALALARKGRRTLLVEQAAEFSEVGAGIQLGPNIMRMFDALGVTDQINASAVFPDMLTMRDGFSGAPIVEIPLGAAFEERFGRPYGVIFRPDLHNTLIDAANEAGVLLEGDRGVIGDRHGGRGHVVDLAGEDQHLAHVQGE